MTSAPTVLDLNADLGEGIGDDAAMLTVVTSANVACGGHAGDAGSMRSVCAQAAAAGVRIGAHPSYWDRESFGRNPQEIDEHTLTEQLRTQVSTLIQAATAVGAAVTYLKPHGALYHAAAREPAHARAVVQVAAEVGCAVVGPPGGLMLRLAEARGLLAYPEGFADRGYAVTGALLPRSEPGAVITDPDEVAARVAQLVRTGTMTAADGTSVSLPVRTLCVHGDTPGAVGLARRVRAALEDARLAPRAFT
ncbi:5-oxoprolinase subunit PxpA [Ruania zhangjianzhongii]|uniref:5-oxoprolinase subunit PxpA n=1 Tax=Ruania zhangjianzhongii TaxID=2603206 RepID=UPI0011C91E51|nr:5-oxoprolinase subunit PxpA [Ruania zhangjianzhongii]